MSERVKTGGRKKGTPNKINTSVKDNMIEVFDQIGGVTHMKAWALANPTPFYSLYAKLLPIQTEISGADGGAIEIKQIVINGR